MRKPRAQERPGRRINNIVSSGPSESPDETEALRRRLAEVEAELSFYRSKDEWLQSALTTQRRARQMLEAGLSAGYSDTVARIREVVCSLVPPQAKLLVVSKGDQELVQFESREAWHFPQNDEGVYAGYHPRDSAEAISQLKSLIAKGAEFLLLPNTAFWWLEHYRELEEWLEHSNTPFWRDERCAIYKLSFGPRTSDHALVPAPSLGKVALSRARRASAETGLKAPAGRQRSDVLCFPIIDWDFRFQRPQQLMLRFAEAGHRVFYLSHRFRKSGEPYSLQALKPSLWEASLRGPRYNAHQGVLDEGHRECLFEALSKLCRDHSFGSTVAMVQSPFWWPLAKQAASAFNWRVVYDCMDHHAGFSHSNPMLIEHERDLLSKADLVVASSALLELQARRYARKVLLVRNGCDYEHFAGIAAVPRSARPVIGYYGAIADWFDSDLVADLAERRPDWDFILVGSTFSADLSRLSTLPNVSLPGEQPYAEIPGWLAKFDVALLPFKRTPLTEAANPVKAYEIFASGKPLVSVPLPEMIPLAPLARLASTVDEFEQAVQAELNEIDADSKRKRRAVARNNTWERRFQKLSAALQHLLVKPDRLAPISVRPKQIPTPFV